MAKQLIVACTEEQIIKFTLKDTLHSIFHFPRSNKPHDSQIYEQILLKI